MCMRIRRCAVERRARSHSEPVTNAIKAPRGAEKLEREDMDGEKVGWERCVNHERDIFATVM